MTQEDYSKVPPPHLLKKFSEQAREDSQKRGHAGYCKTFAKLCIDWALNSKSSPDNLQIRSYDITPPSELVQQWRSEWIYNAPGDLDELGFLANRAAQWAADQELDACCEFVGAEGWTTAIAAELRAARRPKPSSLKPITDINPHDDIERLSLHLRDCVQKADSNWAYVNIDVLLDAAEYLERFAHGGGFNG